MREASTVGDRAPAVTVITSTYNRARVLRHAIQSVVNQSFEDWEQIVVGDACTDDSAACVESFADERVRFVNLPERCGEQFGPHNRGVELARGRYIAFLNHDDLYLPDHLQTCVAKLESSGADLVWAPCVRACPAPEAGGYPVRFELTNVPDAAGGYSPSLFYFSSSWVFRRELAARVGPWHAADRLFVTPSQDWLFRAWRSGAVLRCLPRVTVVIVPAGSRRGSYTRKISSDHEWLVSWLADPIHRQLMIEGAAIGEAMKTVDAVPLRFLLRRLTARIIYRGPLSLGLHPLSWIMAVKAGRGGLVRKIRKITGSDRT